MNLNHFKGLIKLSVSSIILLLILSILLAPLAILLGCIIWINVEIVNFCRTKEKLYNYIWILMLLGTILFPISLLFLLLKYFYKLFSWTIDYWFKHNVNEYIKFFITLLMFIFAPFTLFCYLFWWFWIELKKDKHLQNNLGLLIFVFIIASLLFPFTIIALLLKYLINFISFIIKAKRTQKAINDFRNGYSDSFDQNNNKEPKEVEATVIE